MNLIDSYLHENRVRLRLAHYGLSNDFSILMFTPMSQATSYTEFLVVDKQNGPTLVAKTPRTAVGNGLLTQESQILSLLQTMQHGAAPLVPNVLACEEYRGQLILLQTAVVGSKLTPHSDQEKLAVHSAQITAWLAEIQQFPTIQRSHTQPIQQPATWFQQQIEYPVLYFTKCFPISEKEVRLLVRTWDIVAAGKTANLPTMLEHRALNINHLLLTKNGKIGINNWSFATPTGLPASDLFQLLTNIVVGLSGTTARPMFARAVRHAFFAQDHWARRCIRQYAQQLQLPNELLTVLFTVTWLRHLAHYLMHLNQIDTIDQSVLDAPQTRECTPATAQQLRNHPYYALWEYAVEQPHQLNW